MEVCKDCVYLLDSNEYFTQIIGGKMTCLAFYPAPIPEDILSGEVGHGEPHPSQQNQLVYTPLTSHEEGGS
jgi:hypothetical protein